jgi:hypothetical protein
VHRRDDPQILQTPVGDLLGNQRFRNHAGDVPSRIQNRICQGAHEPDPGTTINQRQLASNESLAQCAGGGQVLRARPGVGSREHADALHAAHASLPSETSVDDGNDPADDALVDPPSTLRLVERRVRQPVDDRLPLYSTLCLDQQHLPSCPRVGIAPQLSLPSIHPTARDCFVTAQHGATRQATEGVTGDDGRAVDVATQGFGAKR